MLKKGVQKLMLFGAIFVSSFFMSSVQASNNPFEEKRVLFISSYSPSFDTFYEQVEGINDAFYGYPVTVDMEFMDSKRFLSEENLNNFENSITYKLSHIEYDLVIVADDNGLVFVMEHQQELFEGLPIIFLGINKQANALQYAEDPFVSGIVEAVSIRETIELATDLNPAGEKVVAIVDATPTGRAVLETFNKQSTYFDDLTFETLDLSELTMDELLEELSLLDEKSHVLLIAAHRDYQGNTYEFKDSLDRMLSVAYVPIYHLYEHGVGDGLLGGKVVSHYIQGQMAAVMALDYFEGGEFSSFDVVEDSPNLYLLDYSVLKKFGLNEKRLPIDVVFLSKDLGFFEENKELIIFSFIMFAVFLVIIFLLLWILQYRGKLQKQAQQNSEKLKKVNEKLEFTSYHDYLTGLYNRNFYEERMSVLDTLSEKKLSIVLVDVNGLKLINDAFGHIAGDKSLVETAKILTDIFPTSDVARIGGDEFTIINVGLEEEEVLTRMKQVRDRTKTIKIEGITLSVSIGYSMKTDQYMLAREVFTEAEDWMYREKLNQVPSNRSSIIDTIVTTINQKDVYSEVHSKKVSLLAIKVAEYVGLEERFISEIRTAGLLHDIGKIIVPIEILKKEGPLTKPEFNEIKKHPEIGYRILNSVSELRQISEYVFCHHERYDGKGYPRGVKGMDIPLQARIISVADSIDAMLSDRLYRSKLTKEVCLSELRKNRGSQFCPEVVDAVIPHFDELYEIATRMPDE